LYYCVFINNEDIKMFSALCRDGPWITAARLAAPRLRGPRLKRAAIDPTCCGISAIYLLFSLMDAPVRQQTKKKSRSSEELAGIARGYANASVLKHNQNGPTLHTVRGERGLEHTPRLLFPPWFAALPPLHSLPVMSHHTWRDALLIQGNRGN
jgi:hypothetical protein